MSFSRAFPYFHKPVRLRLAGGYSLLETLIAFVVLVVFVVLAYSFLFRNPASMSALKPRATEERGIPEVKPPGTATPTAPVETTPAPAGQPSSGTAGR